MTKATMALSMARDNEEFMKVARQSRSAGSDDRVVELVRPLGLVLADDGQGNVYVQTIAPKGNAARSGMVRGEYMYDFDLISIRGGHTSETMLSLVFGTY